MGKGRFKEKKKLVELSTKREARLDGGRGGVEREEEEEIFLEGSGG